MVNPREDYYAALELRPNADPDEIKKQFKKLARLYHPDRNPGKEEIFKEKFQKIQAAHEVLSDPERRSKYDAERRKAGIYPYAARPNNPVRNAFAGAYYPAPPRSPTQPVYERRPRPQSAYFRNSHYASDASEPTSRFSSTYSRPPPPPPPSPSPFHSHSATTEAEDRAEAWKAFGKASDAKRAGHYTKSRPDEDTRKREPTQDHAGKPGLGRSNTTAGTRKAGYNPSVLDGDWEPQAQKTSSYTTHNRDFLRPPPFSRGTVPTTTPPPPPKASTPTKDRKPDPLRDFRSHYGEDVPFTEGTPRMSTPYTQHGGETTYFSSEFLRRSSSTHDATRLNRTAKHLRPEPIFQQKSSPPRARSVSPSPRLDPGQPGPATNDTSQKTPPRTRPRKDSSKPTFDIHNQVSSDADTSSGAESAPCEPQNSDIEVEATNRPGQQQEETMNTSQPSQNQQQASSHTAPPNTHADGTDEGVGHKMYNQFSIPTPNIFAQNPAYQNTDLRFTSNIPLNANNASTMRSNTSETRNNEPVQPQFLSSNWNPNFQAGANPTSPNRRSMSRSKSPSKRSPMGRVRPPPPLNTHTGPSAFNTQPNPFDLSGLKLEIPSANDNSRSPANDKSPFSKVPPPPAGHPPKKDTEEQLERPRGPVKFSSDEWVKQFPGPNWAYPQPTNGNTSPTRGTVPSRRISIAEAERKKVKKQVPTTSGVVHEETDGSEPQKDQILPPRRTTPAPPKAEPKPPSPDPMDVDTDTQSNAPTQSGPRLYPVQPGRSDWREPIPRKPEDNIYIPTATPLPTKAPTTLPTTIPGTTSFTPPGSYSGPPKSTKKTAQRPPADHDHLDLRPMGSVNPLGGSGQPFDNFSEMRMNVPFNSQPSKQISFDGKPFDLPSMPIGPQPLTDRFTQSGWDKYMSQFFAYMREFHKYEGILLGRLSRHYDENGRSLSELRDARAMELQLLTSGREEGNGSSGADALVAAGKEDAKVSTHLSVACQRRVDYMEAFQRAWERAVREGYVKG